MPDATRRVPPGGRSPSPIPRLATAPGLLLLLTCSGCSGVLDPQGPVAAANRAILVDALAIMLAIVVPTLLATLAFAWWFRASNPRARYRPDWAFSGRIELVVWSIPLLVIMFLGGLIWIGSHRLDPARALASDGQPLEVQVVSLDWKWLFIYPGQDIASVNQLVVPAGQPVHFALTSASVMNLFFVPQLGSMIAAMNGMVTQLHLQADHPGEFDGLSAQLSGDGFADMHFKVRAVPPDDFVAWVAATRASGPSLDRAGYAALSHQSRHVAPHAFRAVAPGLFHAIATQQIPPSPGPDSGAAGPRVRPESEN